MRERQIGEEVRRVQTKIEQLLDEHRLLKFARLSVVNQQN